MSVTAYVEPLIHNPNRIGTEQVLTLLAHSHGTDSRCRCIPRVTIISKSCSSVVSPIGTHHTVGIEAPAQPVVGARGSGQIGSKADTQDDLFRFYAQVPRQCGQQARDGMAIEMDAFFSVQPTGDVGLNAVPIDVFTFKAGIGGISGIVNDVGVVINVVP